MVDIYGSQPVMHVAPVALVQTRQEAMDSSGVRSI